MFAFKIGLIMWLMGVFQRKTLIWLNNNEVMVLDYVCFYMHIEMKREREREKRLHKNGKESGMKKTYIIQTFYNILRIEMPWTCLIRPPVLDYVCGLRSTHSQSLSEQYVCANVRSKKNTPQQQQQQYNKIGGKKRRQRRCQE